MLSILSLILPWTAARAVAPPPGETIDGVPPRLSYTYGDVSFWRPGAEEWTVAQVNTPLAPGDALYSADDASVEVQIGGRTFIRAGSETELVLSNREPHYLQFEVTTGQVALDARNLDPDLKIEIDTPGAAFTVDVDGYYRVDVTGDTTTFISRHGGRATMLSAAGVPSAIAPGERVIVGGETSVARTAAPDLDAWDRWNYERTDHLINTASSRYVSPDVYGLEELDRHGTWYDERDYGPVWVPSRVGASWAPYTVGRWIWDPFYGWTWIDAAPWGWAPCHYGRWVRVRGYWGWAPGPVIARPVYAPAVVAFFGGSSFSVGVGLGVPAVGWVALGWGEPIVPWWGHVGFLGVPWWGGWGGPRYVNNVFIYNKTVIHARHIHKYRHARHGLAYHGHDKFGRGHHQPGRWRDVDPRHLQPIHGKLPVRPVAASLTPRLDRATRPSDRLRRRPVVATRPANDVRGRLREAGLRVPDERTPRQRIVSPSRPGESPDRRALGDERARSRPNDPIAARPREDGRDTTRPRAAVRPDRLQRGTRPEIPGRREDSPRNIERPAERDSPSRLQPREDRSQHDRLTRPVAPGTSGERPSDRARLSRPQPPSRSSEQPRERASERPATSRIDRAEPRERRLSRPDLPTRRIEPPRQNVQPRVQREERPSRQARPNSPLIEQPRQNPRPRLQREERPVRQARPSSPQIEQPSSSPRTRQSRPSAAAPQAARPRAQEPSRSRPHVYRDGAARSAQPSQSSRSIRSAPSSFYGSGRASMGSSRHSAPSGGSGRGLSRGR